MLGETVKKTERKERYPFGWDRLRMGKQSGVMYECVGVGVIGTDIGICFIQMSISPLKVEFPHMFM